jgi:hypothetical protein
MNGQMKIFMCINLTISNDNSPSTVAGVLGDCLTDTHISPALVATTTLISFKHLSELLEDVGYVTQGWL